MHSQRFSKRSIDSLDLVSTARCSSTYGVDLGEVRKVCGGGGEGVVQGTS